MNKLDAVIAQYARAMDRLHAALKQPKDEFMRDSAIQRFEFTFDLAWKAIKAFLEARRGILCTSPKTCFRDAYAQKLISYEDFWLTLTDMRNATAHTYNEEEAERVYTQLPKALEHFRMLLAELKKQDVSP